jgi:DNA-binding transcriptional regulator YdaS (Cro superfamily)
MPRKQRTAHKPRTVDKKWFKTRLAEIGLSQRGLARALDVDPAIVTLIFDGRRRIQPEEVPLLARILNATEMQVMRAAGMSVPVPTKAGTVRVVGHIGGTEPEFDWTAHVDEIPAPPDVPPETVALRFSAAHDIRDGEIIFVTPPTLQPTELLNYRVLASVDGNGVCVGFLRRGSKPGVMTLIDETGQQLNNVKVLWATQVLWVKYA